VTLIVAVKDSDIKAYEVNTFAYGPIEHNDVEVTKALIEKLSTEGYECSQVKPVTITELSQV